MRSDNCAAQSKLPRFASRLAWLAVTVLAISACGTTTHHQAGDQPWPSEGTTASSASPAVPGAAAGAAAIAAYLGMWQDFAAAGVTSDWESPHLGDHATGAALSQMSRGLYADRYNGLVTKGAPIDHPQVQSVAPQASPTTVTISDCGDSTHWLKYVASTGAPANDGPGGHRAITAEVQKGADGVWKVATFAVQGVGSC